MDWDLGVSTLHLLDRIQTSIDYFNRKCSRPLAAVTDPNTGFVIKPTQLFVTNRDTNKINSDELQALAHQTHEYAGADSVKIDAGMLDEALADSLRDLEADVEARRTEITERWTGDLREHPQFQEWIVPGPWSARTDGLGNTAETKVTVKLEVK